MSENKKSGNPDLIEDQTQETKDQTQESKKKAAAPDPWERVEVSLPRAGDREDPNLVVGLNGVNYLLPRGKKSMVPRCVAEEIARSEKARDLFNETSEQMLAK